MKHAAAVNVRQKLYTDRSLSEVLFGLQKRCILAIHPHGLQVLFPRQALAKIASARGFPPGLFAIHDVERHLIVQHKSVHLWILDVMPRFFPPHDGRSFRVFGEVRALQSGHQIWTAPRQGPIREMIPFPSIDFKPAHRLLQSFASRELVKWNVLCLQFRPHRVQVWLVLPRLEIGLRTAPGGGRKLRKIPRGISEDHRGAIVAVQHSIYELAFVEVDVGQFNHVWPSGIPLQIWRGDRADQLFWRLV
mmetsp:Transcript_33712/g.72770  ORF Transcript_33712/g.72770 Transcript_33712/m.72770 type:complete len:248 (-) Transcript_33712:650-1393(-)